MTSLHRRHRSRSCIERPRTQTAASASPDVLALIAHDLRLPLAALRLSSEMALDGLGDSDDQQRLIETMYRQVGALERLTLDLLDAFADGRLTPNDHAALDLTGLAASVVSEFGVALAGRRRLAFVGGEEMPAFGNAAKLRVALRNIVANALKYSPDASTVTVCVTRRGGRCLVAVSDQGAGIASDDLAHIFEREYRADSDRRRAPGHGLGLFIARQIVEAHGGRITVASTPGAGSTFEIDLPALLPDAEVCVEPVAAIGSR